MDLDLRGWVTLVVLLVGPALLIFTILNVMRVRRGKFHRQRIKRSR